LLEIRLTRSRFVLVFLAKTVLAQRQNFRKVVKRQVRCQSNSGMPSTTSKMHASQDNCSDSRLTFFLASLNHLADTPMTDQDPDSTTASQADARKFSPLSKRQRRVVGVLVEKSKTTPAGYPMTLNAIRTACNQKSNRSPLMDLREDEVEDTLYELRQLGAVAEVHSGGRVPKYKHYLYEWLGVERAELAVMTELLLRGEQSLGDLRARSSRMEPIAGLEELKPILDSLLKKGLVVELTPPGRGQIVTHNLYTPEELQHLQADFAEGGPGAAAHESHRSAPRDDERLEQVESQLQELREALAEVQKRLDALES
jgi:uncharacterized protein YceH (UPF0502 family)